MEQNINLKLDIKELKAYEPSKVESDIYKFWEKSGFLKPEYNKKENKQDRFTIILPPPNANASLHLGHASGFSYQDVIGRFQRMHDKEVLLLPGKDHAGIQTEVVFEKELAKKKIRKRELGREEFYKQCYEFSMMNAATARSQEKSLGLSGDYTRELFTLDPRIQKTVFETFKKMYEEGLVYRGKRIVNWCVRCQTALADIDTEHSPQKGKLYYIKYGPFIIATTRPETKLADTAIAVNPKDERYKKYIGTEVEIESVEGKYKLPVIADRNVDMNFGTGVLKVTPGHSIEDYRIGSLNNLPIKTVIDFRGRMLESLEGKASKYAGMKVAEAREEIVKDLEALGLIEKIEEIDNNIRVCERCKGVIEPLISYQWFVKTDDLKNEAIKRVNDGEIEFHPKRQQANFIHWLSIPEDWCISRQLWWGYQIPVWYCGGKTQVIDSNGDITEKYGNENGCGNIIISTKGKPEACPKCKSNNIVQDEDVLDTWYSSGQWPYATLLATEGDFERYFPTQVMETGRDIIFFWVARMVMMSLYRFEKVPFSHVYLHGIVLDKEGKKQSKSKNNGIDPLVMVNKYGADALRLSFIVGNGPDQDYKLYEEKIKGFRNFINKIWNASRFTILETEKLDDKTNPILDPSVFKEIPQLNEILEAHETHLKEVNRLMEEYKFGTAGEEIFNYFWHRFCDIDIETIKRLSNENTIEKALLTSLSIYILIDELKIMHPFIPFVTEYIWQILLERKIVKDKTIMYSKYPN